MIKTNEELRKEIEDLKKSQLNKQERLKLEKELQELKDNNFTGKKALKMTGKFFLGVGKVINQYAKNQANKKR